MWKPIVLTIAAFLVLGTLFPAAMAKGRQDQEHAAPSAHGEDDDDEAPRARGHADDAPQGDEEGDPAGPDNDPAGATPAAADGGYRHAFGQLEDEERVDAKTAWAEAEKGKPSWFATFVAKIRGHDEGADDDVDASDGAGPHGEEENRHRGFAQALTRVPSKVAEKLHLILAGTWGADKPAE
ncbi:MAG TPA: hypothetical protein VI997_01090 [Candidatus Thermoplasmatota archaeon]|nr:hypothetical protein [Candidatus Thermoplasmatota archaeon]